MANGNGYTPTEKKIMAVIDDGQWHNRAELLPCLWDDQNEKPMSALEMCMSDLRKKLEPRGRDVVGRNGAYRLVRLLADPNDGKS